MRTIIIKGLISIYLLKTIKNDKINILKIIIQND